MISDEMREKWSEKIDTVYEAERMCNITLSGWEEEFLDSISIRLEKGMDLTHKQSKCLNRIYEKIG